MEFALVGRSSNHSRTTQNPISPIQPDFPEILDHFLKKGISTIVPTQTVHYHKGKSLKITIHLQFTLFEPRQMGTVISHDPLHVNFLSIASRKLFSRSSMITSMRSGENFTTPVTVGSGFFVV